MCGICGVITENNSALNEGVIRQMCRQMIHRGPDDEGVYLGGDRNYSVGLGHRRLSIIDLKSGHQPMFNEDKSLILVFNGEIYNFQELRVELEKKGHKFYTNSDTEVVVHLYEEYKEECLNYLRGPFAFAIWDEKEKLLFAARDRVGKRPFLYAIKGGNFVFASEFKALLAYVDISKEINKEALDAYLTYGYVPAPLSIYQDIQKLLPGQYLIFKNGKIRISKYWSLDFKNKTNLTEEQIRGQVRELVNESVRIRMVSDVPLGAFLSGGIDSSIVVGLMSGLSKKKIKTFSIGFSEETYNELEYASIVARKFNTEHLEFIVEPKIEDVLPLLVRRYGEPYADSSAIPSYYVAKMASSYVKVALNGDGGDELFAGYHRHWANRFASSQMIKALFRFGGKSAIDKSVPQGSHPKSFFARLRRFAQAVVDDPALRYQKWVGFFTDELKSEIYSSEFKKTTSKFNVLIWLEDLFKNAQGLDPVDSFLYVDNLLNLPNDFLSKMDIACMANSLEGRSPFLDYKLMEFAATIPSKFKIKGNFSKYILKTAFKDLLPEAIFNRGKMGFSMPIGFWFRNELKNFVKDILLSRECLKRGYFNLDAIKNLLEVHFSSKNDYSQQIWSLLMLEMWHLNFIDQN